MKYYSNYWEIHSEISASSPKTLFENDFLNRRDRNDYISAEGIFSLFMSSCKTVRQAIRIRDHFVKKQLSQVK